MRIRVRQRAIRCATGWTTSPFPDGILVGRTVIAVSPVLFVFFQNLANRFFDDHSCYFNSDAHIIPRLFQPLLWYCGFRLGCDWPQGQEEYSDSSCSSHLKWVTIYLLDYFKLTHSLWLA